MRSPIHWIFNLAEFSAVFDLDNLRVGAFLQTHCLVGPRSALDGSPFNGLVFMMFLERL